MDDHFHAANIYMYFLYNGTQIMLSDMYVIHLSTSLDLHQTAYTIHSLEHLVQLEFHQIIKPKLMFPNCICILKNLTWFHVPFPRNLIIHKRTHFSPSCWLTL